MTVRADQEPSPRPPTLLDAILPVVVLIALIALTIVLFGISATDGPLQVALLLSAAFASLMALKNGYTSAAVADAAIGGVTTAMSASFIDSRRPVRVRRFKVPSAPKTAAALPEPSQPATPGVAVDFGGDAGDSR